MHKTIKKRKILAFLLVTALLMNSNITAATGMAATDDSPNGNGIQGASVSLGGWHSAAITKDGDLYCWGKNYYGQVGNGSTEDQLTPVKILSNVASVSLGQYHSAAITRDGDLYCWGDNSYGQVGNGSWKDQHTPTKILSNVASVSLGDDHSAAITRDGNLYCWGYNYYGQVGNGSTEDQLTPVKILSNVASVSLGYYYSAAITRDGDLYCWGENYDGQVGNGSTKNQFTPARILSNVASVSLGQYHSAAITRDGDLYCWGNNDGQVGNGSWKDQLTPAKILSNVASVSLGYFHSAAITRDGDLYCWGDNYSGQVGNGSTEDQLTPCKVLENISVGGGTGDGTFPDDAEKKLQCRSSCTVEVGHSQTLSAEAYEDSLEKLKTLTDNVTWKSEDPDIVTVENIGFILPVNPTRYTVENDSYETWKATGIVYVKGISKGSAAITGTASDGSTVSCQVTVTEPENSISSGGGSGGGGSFVLGEESSGSGSSSAAEFFPANWSLKSTVFPVEISKEEKDDGQYTIKGTVGIGKSDWLDDDETWNQFKQNVSSAQKYTGRVNCLDSYRDTWGVKSLTAVSTDKFQALPKLSVMGYFENTYDKNDNLVSSKGGLAADAKWSGSISWQFVTPIGPLYLNLSGSGKISCDLSTKYNYAEQSLKIADGKLKLTPSVTLEGGYGIDKVATIGAQGELSVPITVVPLSKGEFEAKAALHVKLIFVIDYTHDLATYKTTLWDTTNKNKGTKNIKNLNILKIPEENFSEMDTSFADAEGKWNTGAEKKKLKKLGRAISDTIGNSIMTLQEGILPSSLPMQAQIGDKTVMVFQAYDGARTTLNSTVLKYSVCENGVWSEPKAVSDDGYGDMYADMKVVNGKLVLAWQKIKKEISGNVETDSETVLKDITENSEICFSAFDEESDTFTTFRQVTDNREYDMMPQICTNSDDIVVTWVRNDAADLMQKSGTNTIYTAKWNGSSFEEEKALSQAPGTIDDYVVYEDTEGIQSFFVGQSNGLTAAFDTDGQVLSELSELMMASEDGAISGLNYADGKVSCISQGKLYTYDIANGEMDSFLAGESAFGSAVQFCSNGEKSGYIWSIYDEESGIGSIYASMATENGYSEPVVICEKENTIWRYFSPILDTEGNWHIVANALNTETDINSLEYITKKQESRLEAAGASIDEDNVVDGLTGIDYFVTNTEDTTIHNIIIEITLEDGTVIKKTVPVTILPGESKAGTAYVDLGEAATQKVTVSVYAEDQSDRTDCTFTDQIGRSDVSVTAVSSETAEEVEITATLQNTSPINANATLYLYGDAEKTTELQKQSEITVDANGSKQVRFTLQKKNIIYNDNDAAYLTLYTTTEEGDYDEDNNTAYVILYKSENDVEAEPTSTPSIKPSMKPTNTPDIRPSMKPAATTKPSNNVTLIQAGYQTTVDNMKYKVIKVDGDQTGEVALIGSIRKKSDKKFTSLKMADTVTINGKSFKITTIGGKAFSGYKHLKTITIGKYIKTIGNKAFYKCTSLKKIVIPPKVTRIGKQTFCGCKKLKNITIKTKKLTVKRVGANAFKGISPKVKIKVPKDKLKFYKKILQKKGVGSKIKMFSL